MGGLLTFSFSKNFHMSSFLAITYIQPPTGESGVRDDPPKVTSLWKARILPYLEVEYLKMNSLWI
jgi:hypothetical protein